MNIFKRYIDKQKIVTVNIELPVTGASIFVVIPCLNEPDIISTINSLAECYPPQSKIDVIIVVNSAEDSPNQILNQNLVTISDIEEWKQNNPDSFLNINHIHVTDLPRKFAGVGWARKIGMDEAIKQLERSGQDEGIIVSLDADCTVLPNYLKAIDQSFKENPKVNFFTICFSHRFEDVKLSGSEREGIIRYELHMRYFRNAMKWCGYPHSIHTVGSSFAVKASAYVKQGGMNRRKAGEDFYFLHKLVLLGPYGTINSTTVYPATRQSDRVPFGTGAAMKKWAEGNRELFTTYSFDSFLSLKPFFNNPAQFSDLNEERLNEIFDTYHEGLKSYLKDNEMAKVLLALQANCSSTFIFVKRFFHLINAFWIIKYLNYVHGKFFHHGDLYSEVCRLLMNNGIEFRQDIQPGDILKIYRDLDTKSN